MRPRRRHHRSAAVVGLLAGLALLLGAVVDGGVSTPTRTDQRGSTAAVPLGDAHAAVSAQPREDHAPWGRTLPPSPPLALLVAGLVGLTAGVALTSAAPVAGPRHRAPALRAARHRGPPSLV